MLILDYYAIISFELINIVVYSQQYIRIINIFKKNYK